MLGNIENGKKQHATQNSSSQRQHDMWKSAPALFGPSLQRGTTLWIDGLEKIIGGKGI